MGLMSATDMMSMAQDMVDYTKQPQFNNQNVNNNGGFPFTNSAFPKHLENMHNVINQNNGLTSFGNGNSNNQQATGGFANQGRSNANAEVPQRGSDILSQPIFPSENNRFATSNSNRQGGSSGNGNTVSNSGQFNQNGNSNGFGGSNDDFNGQQPTVYVSSLGEISTDPNLRFNPFTTAIVNTRTFETLPSNVDPVLTSAYQIQKLALHGQVNQLNGNAQVKGQSNEENLFENHQLLQHQINQLSASASNEPQVNQQQSTAHGSNTPTKFNANNNPPSNEQTDSVLTAVYSGSGDLLSQTIGQYGKGTAESGRDPHVSVLVNSLGETVLTPIYSGEGNLLSQTIGEKGSGNKNDFREAPKSDSTTTAASIGKLITMI